MNFALDAHLRNYLLCWFCAQESTFINYSFIKINTHLLPTNLYIIAPAIDWYKFVDVIVLLNQVIQLTTLYCNVIVLCSQNKNNQCGWRNSSLLYTDGACNCPINNQGVWDGRSRKSILIIFYPADWSLCAWTELC